jgi:3-oxoacyl-[acyl-carrier-protein] synthase III
MAIALTGTAKTKTRCKTETLGVKVLGTGHGIPLQAVSNAELDIEGIDPEWILQRTGIMSRYHAPASQATSDLALEAAENCLKAAGQTASDVDLILVATMTPDHFTPSTACIVQAKLGAVCGAIDLNAACSGFMYSLTAGAQFVRTGCYRRVLVIGADKMSMVVDPRDPKTYPLFGDGAAAVLLGPDDRDEATASGILAFRLGSVGELGHTLIIPACGSRQPASHSALDARDQFLKMEGRSVFKWAVRLVPEIVNNLLADAQLSIEDIDLFVFHQANRRILEAATEAIGVSSERVFCNVDRFGNTSAGSIPICLHEALTTGRIKPGSHVLMAGFGSGLTWGGCIYRW